MYNLPLLLLLQVITYQTHSTEVILVDRYYLYL